MARERYQNLPEEEKNKNGQCSCELYKSFWRRKNKKRQYGCQRYKNHPDNEKQRLVEYKKNVSKTHKIKTD